jgi:hypothetical protein
MKKTGRELFHPYSISIQFDFWHAVRETETFPLRKQLICLSFRESDFDWTLNKHENSGSNSIQNVILFENLCLFSWIGIQQVIEKDILNVKRKKPTDDWFKKFNRIKSKRGAPDQPSSGLTSLFGRDIIVLRGAQSLLLCILCNGACCQFLLCLCSPIPIPITRNNESDTQVRQSIASEFSSVSHPH